MLVGNADPKSLADGAPALAGFSCSSPFEARLAGQLCGTDQTVHLTSPAVRQDDLPRLLVGSRGSMGLLLEMSLRVLPLAEAQLGLVFEKPGLPDAVAFTNQLTAAAEPLTGASYYRGRLHLRFSGRDGTLQRLRQELGGEQDSANWWTDLQQWRFPWGAARWRNYREQLAVEPRANSDWLADWNGGLIWSVDRESTAASAVDLQQMSAATGVRGEIEQRLRAAFDPQAVFSGGVR